MNKIEIKKDEIGYYLKDCPIGKKLPLSCQTEGCPYWDGYIFLGVQYYGDENYVSSQWRKIMYDEVKVADYVRCLGEEK